MVPLKWGDVLSTLLPGAAALYAISPYFARLDAILQNLDKAGLVGANFNANRRFSTAVNLDLTLRRVEKIDGYGRQLRGWKHRPVAFLGRQPRFTRQFEKDGHLDQVLV
jgi:hypothetical protein